MLSQGGGGRQRQISLKKGEWSCLFVFRVCCFRFLFDFFSRCAQQVGKGWGVAVFNGRRLAKEVVAAANSHGT
jgi:hypothetical protein